MKYYKSYIVSLLVLLLSFFAANIDAKKIKGVKFLGPNPHYPAFISENDILIAAYGISADIKTLPTGTYEISLRRYLPFIWKFISPIYHQEIVIENFDGFKDGQLVDLFASDKPISALKNKKVDGSHYFFELKYLDDSKYIHVAKSLPFRLYRFGRLAGVPDQLAVVDYVSLKSTSLARNSATLKVTLGSPLLENQKMKIRFLNVATGNKARTTVYFKADKRYEIGESIYPRFDIFKMNPGFYFTEVYIHRGFFRPYKRIYRSLPIALGYNFIA